MPVNQAEAFRRCPSCWSEARETAIFCRMCGERLPPVDWQAEASSRDSAAESDALTGFCSACGYRNLPGEIFCLRCGVQLPPVASLPPPRPSRFSG